MTLEGATARRKDKIILFQMVAERCTAVVSELTALSEAIVLSEATADFKASTTVRMDFGSSRPLDVSNCVGHFMVLGLERGFLYGD